MLSVVIPTLLMGPKDIFQHTLDVLNSSEVVSEIIIIDNTDSKSFRSFYHPTEKFIIIEPGKNIFVNKAWNIGLQQSTSQLFLILNDDILIHPDVLGTCVNTYKNLHQPGILTVRTVINKNIDEYLSLVKLMLKERLEVTTNVPEGRIGWFMLGDIENWEDIPEEIDIFYGDNFIYEMAKKNGLINYMIESGVVISHNQSSTVLNQEFIKIKTPVANNDHIQWPKIKKRYNF